MKDIMNEKNDGPYLIDNFRLLIAHILIEYLHLGSMRVKRKQARNGQNFSLVCCLWTLKPKEPTDSTKINRPGHNIRMY